ncbi:ComEC family competence protein [Erythrobacter sp. LQ02-29]|nr:ComEC family competence protein [Erythrobacter sp. LQ02-29]
MASSNVPNVPMGAGPGPGDAAAQHVPWHSRVHLSSIATRLDSALANAGFDRAPWLAVVLAGGIASWFALHSRWEWGAAIAAALLMALWGWAISRNETREYLGRAVMIATLVFALGIGLVWARSATVGAEPLAYPRVVTLQGRVLEREDQPARDRSRLTLAYRDAQDGHARKVRVNVPLLADNAPPDEGDIVRLRSRLMPPAPPLVPGAYDFARTAWFEGLAATGSVIGEIEILSVGQSEAGPFSRAQRHLSQHVRGQLSGSEGAIAAAFASGDRGAIAERDESAMRDAGLTHLLSISGLHVSAVIAAAYFLALRILALWPWLVLRVRLPVMAAAVGASAGIGYTLLTGAEVPTVRSCVGAVLVLLALALGREPLSLRMVAVAASVVMLAWPEALVGPSFQMSFCAVIALVALHNTGPVRRFLAPRDEGMARRFLRHLAMLLLTGFVIEIALMPIVLFHFHRAGLYGAFANVLAIPLTTFVSMPLIALALVLDLVGLGGPVWWLAGWSLDLLLAIANFAASQPGAVKLAPQMSGLTIALFVLGGLWLALWSGRGRLLGLLPVTLALGLLVMTPAPDILIGRDGRNVGIADEEGRLVMLREGRSGYARDTLVELGGRGAETVGIDHSALARCSRDFCTVELDRGDRHWSILMARSRDLVSERALAAACERADIVVADRYLPYTCRPRWLLADRRFLSRSGGLALYLDDRRVATVADGQGEHGWWRAPRDN